MRPSRDHLPISKYYSPEEFDRFKTVGDELGFGHTESGPLVRSSYNADEAGEKTAAS
jgi:lipoic acid synthetase